MMRTWMGILLAAVVTGACGDDGPSTIDAPPAAVDGAVTDGPSATADAPTPVPDATPPAPDAMAAMPDAATGADAGSGFTAAEACAHVCNHVFMDCFMMTPEPGCATECQTDLADCTPAEVDAVHACGDVPCPGDPTPVADCLMMVDCVDG